VGAGKLLEAGVEVHLAFPVKQHLDGPPTLAANVFTQLMEADSRPARNSANLYGSFFRPRGSSMMWTTNSKCMANGHSHSSWEAERKGDGERANPTRPPLPGLGGRILGL
jgi:hypothetical protein